MKNLKEYIKEGLFDNVDKLEGKNGLTNNIKFLKKEITDWIINNTSERVYKNKLSVDMTTTPPTVDYDGGINMSKSITSLNNDGMFQWGEVKGNFNCSYCKSLESLEGCPKEVGGNFWCCGCDALKSLKGGPEKVGDLFDCAYCKSLTTLEGAPEKVENTFYCRGCKSLKTLKGAPEEVGGRFECSWCSELKDLKYAPENVGLSFHCSDCGTQFTEDDVKKVSNVKGEIYI